MLEAVPTSRCGPQFSSSSAAWRVSMPCTVEGRQSAGLRASSLRCGDWTRSFISLPRSNMQSWILGTWSLIWPHGSAFSLSRCAQIDFGHYA